MKPDSLASIMNWSKNLYVFMLGALIVFSGCIGTGTTDGEGDADTAGTTVINNYYNNTTNVIENTPEYTTSTARQPAGAAGSQVTILTINQSAGEGIMKHDWVGMVSYNHSSLGPIETMTGSMTVNSYCAGGLNFDDIWYAPSTNMNTQTPEWFSGSGLECTHELNLVSSPNIAEELWVSVVYQRLPVMIE